jgi:uncharacterized membrane protein
MDPIAHLALATMAFLVTHYAASTPLRGVLVASLGEPRYLGAYSLVSFLTLGWMIYAYLHAPFMPLWQVPGLKLGPLFVMPFALILLACGVMGRNPTAVRQESALKSEEPARGILRVTRHPVMWSFALWAAAHLLARGDTASLIFFGGFLVLALSGTALIDARKAGALGGDWTRFAAVTSNIPFRAIIGGRNRFSLAEIGRMKILTGLVLYAVLFALHPYLFGARPY